MYKKNHTYNTKQAIYKSQEIKTKKDAINIKKGKKNNSIERHNLFKMFNFYNFYAIDEMNKS